MSSPVHGHTLVVQHCVQEGLGVGRSRQGGGVSDRGRDVVVWLSGLGGRRWRWWLLGVVQGEVEAQVGDGPMQGHSVAATVSEGSASLQVSELSAKAG